MEAGVLTDEQIERLIKHALPYYKPGFKDTVHLSIVDFLMTHGVDYESARKFTERLVKEANDEEADRRLYNVDWAYKKVTERRPGMPLRVWGRDAIITHMAEVIKAVDNVENENIARIMAIEWLAELYRILGIERLVRGLIMAEPICSLGARKNAVVYLVNDPSLGIIRAVKWYPSKQELKAIITEECIREVKCNGESGGYVDLRCLSKDCRREVYRCIKSRLSDKEYVKQLMNKHAKWGYDILLNRVHVKKARIVVDEISGTEYINATIYVREGKRRIPLRFRSATIDKILKNREIISRMSTIANLKTVKMALLTVLRNSTHGEEHVPRNNRGKGSNDTEDEKHGGKE